MLMRFFYSFLVIILIGCANKRPDHKTADSKAAKDINEKYVKTKAFFENSMVNHFPNHLNEDYVTFSESLSPEFGNLDFILINRIKDEQFLKLKAESKAKSIGIYNAGDSCLLVVNRFVNSDNFYKINSTSFDLKLINRDCYNKLYPVPNFWHNDFTTDSTDCKLPIDFDIYVLDANMGRFLKEKYPTEGSFMPETWRNGFSKGIAISEKRKIIIYWLVIW